MLNQPLSRRRQTRCDGVYIRRWTRPLHDIRISKQTERVADETPVHDLCKTYINVSFAVLGIFKSLPVRSVY